MATSKELIQMQVDTYGTINRALTNYKKTPKERINTIYIEARLESLEKLWDNFFKNHFNIVRAIEDKEKANVPYFQQDIYTSCEDVYLEYKCKLKEVLLKFTKDVKSPSTSQMSQEQSQGSGCEVRLPQIQLPSFKGNYEEWQTFHDMFQSLIHNNQSLSGVQKLHYLKSCLSGEPENVLKSLSITETNYETAWSKLTRRYNNKKYNCNEILKRLFGQRVIQTESASAIKHLLDTTSSCLKSLENFEVETSTWDPVVNFLVVSKLDPESRKQWETQVNQLQTEELPSWSSLVRFLESRFRTLESISSSKSVSLPNTSITVSKFVSKPKSFHSSVPRENKVVNTTCAMCSESHLLHLCNKFNDLSPEKRTEFVQTNNLCFNCLSPSHSVKQCRVSMSCRRCSKRHHTTLHYEKDHYNESSVNTSKGQVVSQSSQKLESERVAAHFVSEEKRSDILLATALVKAKSIQGHTKVVRVLLDQGSEASFVTEATVQELSLNKEHVNGFISGVGDTNTRTKGSVTLSLQSMHYPAFTVQIKAYVLKSLTTLLPSRATEILNWVELEQLPLADPNYGCPGKVDLILGVEIYSTILQRGLIKQNIHRGLIAQNTQFGWVLSGRVENEALERENKQVISLHMQLREDQLLQQFWEIEREPETIEKKLTKEQIQCEELFNSSTSRDSDGRYIVRLPFRDCEQKSKEGKLREIAIRRFHYLEKRFIRDQNLKDKYTEVINDYISQHHMTQITSIEEINNPASVYLPHHAVVREDKTTTKVRVVFDASAKGINNISLNQELLVGPELQQELRHILMRWRAHRICIVADLVQMYRQVKVDEADTDFQRIVWRSDQTQPIEHYKMLRLTFGTSCAPYLAVRVLQQLARDEESDYPIAASITLRDFYMDDLLTGCQTVTEAIEIYNQMTELMKRGGFQTQKWGSNSEQFLQHIQSENLVEEPNLLNIKSVNNVIKILGITWNNSTDNFEYILKIPETSEPPTKRRVLSEIARLYDPMGWIAPVIIRAKIFIQSLWKTGLGWDVELPNEFVELWSNFKQELLSVNKIIIPRWYELNLNDRTELHVFADASQKAYGAAVYIKIASQSGVRVHLVTAKTRVAPVAKEITIPRMELCAALLATKLINEVAQIMHIHKENLFAWSDSTVTLAWLKGEPSRWSIFVSNRVSEILTMLDREQWNHVSTKHNPADCASRGITVLELANNKLWWHGPEWLCESNEYTTKNEFTTDQELRGKSITVLTTAVTITEDFLWVRFSTLQRALRVLSYCKKILNTTNRVGCDTGRLTKVVTVKEMDEILLHCIRETQKLYYESEIKQIENSKPVKKESVLYNLCPFLDDNNLLRVKGRTQHGQFTFDVKHPIILPGESHITKLIIGDAHIKTLHGGPQIMLNFLRSKYWIIRARDKVKKHYRGCVKCVRYSRQNNNPFMGQLPSYRLQPSRPFLSSGVDFTGFINLRFSPGRGSKSYKGYICLFVCMSTRAIHLEAVSNLTSRGFIAAFQRFVSRRGQCRELFSDNGTNFVGADRELREMFKDAESELPTEISQLLANEGTNWHFIPPHAPNFGGLWEAGVRSTKSHLKRVIGESILTFEEMSTVLSQIEACLNSRPISYLSEDPDDPLPLTPGHFLVGEPLVVIPDEYEKFQQVTGAQRWKLTRRMVTDFWKKWSSEYLVTLNKRYKWVSQTKEPNIGDIVILKDFNLPPAKWLIGKIIEKFPGKDNITRVVSVQTKYGKFKRTCNKLCFLNKD